ncbi:MAG: ATP-binding protein, partial [Bacteroidota bacterium]
MRSPFKFLDPYEYADKEVFFGRDRDTQLLYETLFKTSLLLVYGLSGTGKTSLIQCGLANRFDGTDWYPMFIRRDGDLNASLKRHIQRVLGEDYSGDVSLDLREIYEEYLRPPYLIFDQFEELFILGNEKEQQKFIQQIALILEKELPSKILLVIREEYLGRLYYFEEAVPDIFDHRVRVEPMGRQQVEQVIEDSFQTFNITLAGDPDTLISEIISSVSEEKSLIPLPYLQVYLDF